MSASIEEPSGPRMRVLWLSTFAFTLLFAVWLMFGVLGLKIREELSLTPAQFEWLLATAILAGALPRLNFGIWADQLGGRVVMTALLAFTAIPTYFVTRATNFEELLACAALFGLAGNSFTVGISWVAAWYPASSKGTALGVFGAGNVGASVTKFLGPVMLASMPAAGWFGGIIPGGWRSVPIVYAVLLLITAAAVWFLSPSPDRKPGRGRATKDLYAPLKYARVWRFSLYYVVVFGAYVALAGWLPKYYVDVYALTPANAGYLTALFIFPASLLRPLGGWLSDKFGPRIVTYAVFIGMTAALGVLSVLPVDVAAFTALVFVVGVGMGIGKASVYKYVPNYFPKDVGAVGGLVGMLGALGGFVLPPTFGAIGRATGTPQAAFLALLALTVASLVWLHVTVLRMKAAERRAEELETAPEAVGV